MTKTELLAILTHYDDDQLSLVTSRNGFEDAKVYVTAAQPRRADEHNDTASGDYVTTGRAEAAAGAVGTGTAAVLVAFSGSVVWGARVALGYLSTYVIDDCGAPGQHMIVTEISNASSTRGAPRLGS